VVSIRTRLLPALGVLALLGAVLYVALPAWFHAPLVALNRTMSGLSERVVVVEGHEIRYLEGGEGETVLLLHGIFAEKDHWVEFARQLTPEYRVVAPDLPGFGASTRLAEQSYEYPDQVRLLEAFVQRLALDSVHVAGNSMGGTIAALYAIDHPDRVRSVAFIGAPHGIRSPRASEADRRIAAGEIPLIARSAGEFERMLDLLFVERPFLPRPIVRDAADRAVAGAVYNVRLWEEQQRHPDLLQRRLPELAHPTLTLWGAGDRVFDVSGAGVVERLLPGHELVVMQATGHLPMMERPRDSAAHYLRFLRSTR
jgi:abhydrolase domain-containing protein 6